MVYHGPASEAIDYFASIGIHNLLFHLGTFQNYRSYLSITCLLSEFMQIRANLHILIRKE